MTDTNKEAVELGLYDIDLTTKLSILPAKDIGLYFELNQPGSGGCKVHTLRSVASGLIQRGQFVRVTYRGAVQGGFFVEDIGKALASQGESSDLWTPISGRGPMMLLEDAVVWSDGTEASTLDFEGQPKAAMLIALIEEAKTRGTLSTLIYDFTASLDSDGNAWTDNEPMQFSVGKTLLDVAREIADFGVYFNVLVNEDGTFTLQAFADYGSDKSSSIYFRRGVNCTDITEDEQGAQIANALLIKHDGGYTVASDADSISAFRRREKLIDAIDAGDSANALTYGRALLEFSKEPKKEISTQMFDGMAPYVFTDYICGDWITLDTSGVEQVLRVRNITLSWADADKANVNVGLNTTVTENEIKMATDIRKLFEMWRRSNDGAEVRLPFWAAIGKLVGEATTGAAVYATAVSDAGWLYVGGNIEKIGNIEINHLARYNIHTGQWSKMGTGSPTDVYALACMGTKIFIGRDANAVEEGVIYWDEETETFESIGCGTSPYVYCRSLFVDGTDLYVGGMFEGIGGVTSRNIGLCDTTDNSWTAMDGLIPSEFVTHIKAIAKIENKVFCGGDIHDVSGDSMFIWEWGGLEEWTPVGIGVGWETTETIYALCVYQGKIAIGGFFGDIQGIAGTKGMAFYDPATDEVTSLGGGFHSEPVPWPDGGGTTWGRVQAFTVVGSDLYITGLFHYIGADQMPTNNIVKFDGVGFTNLTSGLNVQGYALASYEGNIVVGGVFETAGGKPIKFLAAYITNLEEILRYLEGNGDQTGEYVHPNHSGDVVSTGDGATTIQPNAVDNTKAADMPAGTVKANPELTDGDPQDMSIEDFAAMLGIPGAQTAKRVLISDASGVITTSDYLVYDETTKVLSLGETIVGFVQSVLFNLSSNISRVLNLITWGSGNSTRFKGTFARGTIDVATAAQSGDTLARFSGAGYDGVTAIQNAATSGEIRVEAAEDLDATHHGTNLGFYITLPGTTTMVRVGTFTANGLELEAGYEFLGDMGLENVLLPKTVSPSVSTYLTARDDLTVRGSAGVIDENYAYITAYPSDGPNYIHVAAGDGGYIRSTNDATADLFRTKWIGITSDNLPNPAAGEVTVRFIGVTYASGTPQATIHSSYDWNFNTTFPLGVATWDGTTLKIVNEPARAGNISSFVSQRLRNTKSFEREKAPGGSDGLVISDVATRQIAMTAGVLWRDLNSFSISAISAGTAFTTHYQRSGGGFNSTGGVTQWPNDKYDDASGTLATIAAGKYACHWVYVDVADGALNVLYGRDEYDTVADAQAEQEPTTAPNNIVYHGCLVGRIIFAASASSASVVESTWKHSQTYVEAGAYGLYQYGDGDDGDATLDGTNLYPWCKLTAANTYEMVRDAYLDNLTISSGVTLKMAYRIFGTATLTLDGTLDCKGGNASGATVGAIAPYGWYPLGVTGGAGIASGGAAADGATSTGSNRVLGGWGGRGAGAWASALQRRGKNGFSSNNFPLPAVGGSRLIRKLDTALANFFANSTNTLIQYAAGQAGGGGAKSAVGTTCNSGGGGGGGGFLFVAFRYIVISASGVVTADGGAGGNASGTAANAGGGGGGGGGIVWLLYDTLTNAGSISAAGGAGGTSVALGTTPLKAVAAVVVQTLVLETSQAGVANCLQRLATAGTGVGAAKNTLYLVATNQNGGTLNDPVVTGWGLTWTKVTGVDYKTIASPTSRLVLYYAYGTPSVNSDSYGANSAEILVTYSSAPTTANAVLYEIQNATGTIVQSATNRKDASGSGLTVTLGSAFGSTNAGAFGVFALDNWATRTAGSGFSIVSDYAGAGSMYIFGEMSYNDTTVDVAGSTNSAAGIAIEIQAVGAMESGTPGQDGAVVHFVNKG